MWPPDPRFCNSPRCDLPSSRMLLGDGPGCSLCVAHAVEHIAPELERLTSRLEALVAAPVPGQLKLVES